MRKTSRSPAPKGAPLPGRGARRGAAAGGDGRGGGLDDGGVEGAGASAGTFPAASAAAARRTAVPVTERPALLLLFMSQTQHHTSLVQNLQNSPRDRTGAASPHRKHHAPELLQTPPHARCARVGHGCALRRAGGRRPPPVRKSRAWILHRRRG